MGADGFIMLMSNTRDEDGLRAIIQGGLPLGRSSVGRRRSGDIWRELVSLV